MSIFLSLFCAFFATIPLLTWCADGLRITWCRCLVWLVLVIGLAAIADPLAIGFLRIDRILFAPHCGTLGWRG